jgi:hypothetical protein
VRWLSAVLLVLALTGCAGTSCDALPALTAERDAERAAFLELVRSGAPSGEVAVVDDRLHALEARVLDLEESCGS